MKKIQKKLVGGEMIFIPHPRFCWKKRKVDIEKVDDDLNYSYENSVKKKDDTISEEASMRRYDTLYTSHVNVIEEYVTITKSNN